MMHDNKLGESDEWYTPPEIFKALDTEFDLDPCSSGGRDFVPAYNRFIKEDNGLIQPWEGFVFMNPPFGGRNGHVPWLEKFIEHGKGIAIVRAYTSSKWFHDHAVKADYLLFPRGKTKFIRPDGSIGKSPGHGIVLLGMGQKAGIVLIRSELGFFIDNQYKE